MDIRTGQCRVGCGACCLDVSILVKAERMTQEYAQESMLTRTLLAHPEYHDNEGALRWLELHGHRVEKEGAEAKITIHPDVKQIKFRWTDHGVFVDIPRKCSALSSLGTCNLFGQASRPPVCDLYPIARQDLDLVADVCTYRFEAGR